MAAVGQQCTGASAPKAPKVLGRYVADDGPRLIVGRTVLGVKRLVDIPADGRRTARHYVIERGPFESFAEITALVADYLDQAHRWGAPPAEIRWLAEDRNEREA